MTRLETIMERIKQIADEEDIKIVVAIGEGGNEFGCKETTTFIKGSRSICNQLLNEIDGTFK
jgi:hypothetical protein